MTGWGLPDRAEIGGREYRIHPDYRDVLNVIAHLTDPDTDEYTRVYVALALFYADFPAMEEDRYQEALDWMLRFISCGEDDRGSTWHRVFDWEQDRNLIVADVNRVAGCEIRALPFCHWWTFVAWFNAIGDGQLAAVVSIREKLRKGKKLSDWERDFYLENRSTVDLRTHYTGAEEAVLKQWGV